MFRYKSQQNLAYYYLLSGIYDKYTFDNTTHDNNINLEENFYTKNDYSNNFNLIDTLSNIKFNQFEFKIPQSHIFYIDISNTVRSIVNNKDKDFLSESNIFSKFYIRNSFNKDKFIEDLYHNIYCKLIDFINQVCNKRTFYNFKNNSKKQCYNFIKNTIFNTEEKNVFFSNSYINDYLIMWTYDLYHKFRSHFFLDNKFKTNHLISYNKLDETPFLVQLSSPNIVYKDFYVEISINYFITLNNMPLTITSFDF